VVTDDQREAVLGAWKGARAEYDKNWSRGNQKAYERFRNSFVDAASARYGIPKGDVRRIVQGPK
jgi:hypothetical protein